MRTIFLVPLFLCVTSAAWPEVMATSTARTTTMAPTTPAATTTPVAPTTPAATTTTEEPIPDSVDVYCPPDQYATINDLKTNDLYDSAVSYCQSKFPSLEFISLTVNDKIGEDSLCIFPPTNPKELKFTIDNELSTTFLSDQKASMPGGNSQRFTFQVDSLLSFNITTNASTLDHSPGFWYGLDLTYNDDAVNSLGYRQFLPDVAEFQFQTQGFEQKRSAYELITFALERIYYIPPGECLTLTLSTNFRTSTASGVVPLCMQGEFHCELADPDTGARTQEYIPIEALVGYDRVVAEDLCFNQDFYIESKFSQSPAWYDVYEKYSTC